jgi:hypothetical protein
MSRVSEPAFRDVAGQLVLGRIGPAVAGVADDDRGFRVRASVKDGREASEGTPSSMAGVLAEMTCSMC